jgi:alanine dehydrogenase
VALSNILLPYLERITTAGPDAILRDRDALAQGFYTREGFCLQRKIAQPLSLPFREVAP